MSLGFRSKTLRLCNFIILSALMFVCSKELSASQFYVATSGSNSNSGTISSPWQTIQFGVSRLSAGDTLVIRGGTYSEGISHHTIPSGIDDSRRTTVQGAPGETVILNGAGTNFDVIEITDVQYVTIDNLGLVGGRDGGSGSATNTCIRIGEGGGWESSYITIKNLTLHHCGEGIYTGGASGANHHILLQHLTVYHNGFPYLGGDHGHGIYITGSYVTLEDSDVYDMESHGVHVYGDYGRTSNNIIRNNRIHGNGSFGLMLSSGYDNIAYNNVIYGNGKRVFSGGFRFYDGANNNRFLNNTVFGNYGYGIWVQSGDGAVVTNNISYGNFIDKIWDDGTRSDISNNLTSDPAFVNAGAGDFHLTSGSQAINAGATLSPMINTDIDGTSRPQDARFDIGAEEFSGAVQSINPKPSLTLRDPTGLFAKCNSDGTTFTIGWDTVPGAETYYVRVDYVANNTNGVRIFEQNLDYYLDQYSGTSFTARVVQGQAYIWWVHGANSASGIGPWSSGSFTCN